MQLQEVTDLKKFDDFVKNHESGSFLQSSVWGTWQESLGQQVYRFFVLSDGETLLSAQVIKTKLPRVNKYYLYIPYGPLIVGDKDSQVFDFFMEGLKQKFPDTIFCRIEPKQNLESTTYSLRLTPHIQPGKTLVIDLSKTSEQLLAEMHHKTRYNIRLAEKHGVKVISEPIITPGHGLHLKEVASLLVETANRQGYKSHGRSYYQKMIDFFGTHPEKQTRLTVYKALYEQELLACGIMIDFGKTRVYLFGGTANEHRNLMAPYALHFQAMLDAQKLALSDYDFWGVETANGDTPGFVRFKLGFGGTPRNYPPAKDLVLNRMWYNAYKVARKINRKIS